MTLKIRLATPLAAATLSMSGAMTAADTITVCASGCQFASILEAIDAAQDGDVIQLAAEIYEEGESIDPAGKEITLRGALDKAGNPLSVLDGGNPVGGTSGVRVLVCRTSETSATIFENLVIQNGYAVGNFTIGNGGGGMYNDASSPTVINCIFENNHAVYNGGGMFNENGSAPTVIDCVFRTNHGLYGGGMLNQSSSPTLEGCLFTGNQAFAGGGLFNFDSSPTVSDSDFCGNLVAGIGLEIASQVSGDPIAGEEAGNCIAIDCDDCDSALSCLGDINGDLLVDSADLGLIIGAWGTANPSIDLNGDGLVDSGDLGLVIGAWGQCP